jgi:nucleoside-diphosphate-sugar epimerase
MNLEGKRVAVTGASGLLGAYVCRSLRSAGASVRGTIRDPAKAPFLIDMGVETIKADLLDATSLKDAFSGCDALIHCAALYTLGPRRWKSFLEANVVGTDNVYGALCQGGPKRVVHISSWGVYRFAYRAPMDESTPLLDGERREGGGYRASKMLSEKRAREHAERCGLQLTVVRPAGIYGARDTVMLPKVRTALRLPLLPHLGLEMSLSYAGDIADAVVRALVTPKSVGESYNLGGDEEPFGDFIREVAKADPRARARFPVSLPSPLVWVLNSDKARADLSFKNRSFAEGVGETYALEAAPSRWASGL